MGAGAVHRLMVCNYRGVIKALVSLSTGEAPAVQTPPANGCRNARDGVGCVAGLTSLPLAQLPCPLLPAAVLG